MNSCAKMQSVEAQSGASRTAEQLIAVAASLREELREGQADVEARGTYSPEMHEKFKAAGFYKALQPLRFDGLELSMTDFFRLVMEIARGCPSTGWCLSLGAGHSYIIASHFDEESQVELFGDGHFIAPHRGPPMGKCIPVEGGYEIEGTWNYSSGVPYSTHFMGGILIEGKGSSDAMDDTHVFVVPRDRYEILDDWGNGRLLGMNGSGSNSVRVARTFVPERLVQRCNWHEADVSGGTHGTRLHGNPMYLGRNLTFTAGEIVAVMGGLAHAALDEYRRLIETKKVLMGPPILRIEDPDFLRHYGHAVGLVETAEQLILQAGERYMANCRRWQEKGIPFSPSDDSFNTALLFHASELVEQAVRLMFATAGSSETSPKSKMARYYRDMSIQRTLVAGLGTLEGTGVSRARSYLFGATHALTRGSHK